MINSPSPAVLFDWPLSTSPFGPLDKLKVGLFLFREPMWTQGEWVRKYENMWVEKMGVKHAIMTSSGSTANELIALRRKWELQQAGEWPRRNKVVFPVNTWISSVSVWINLGFEPVFVDVDRSNLNVYSSSLDRVFRKDRRWRRIATVFYTALLGFYGDLEGCKEVTEQHGARFLMDNCEATFSSYLPKFDVAPRSLLTLATCSTSIFFSHFTMSGTEGGLIFPDSKEEADWYRMARSHGLTRGMPQQYKNPRAHPAFDFYMLGSNYRSSNLQAYMASLDFERAYRFSVTKRRRIFDTLNQKLDFTKFETFNGGYIGQIPLAIPLLSLRERAPIERWLNNNGVMTRPIVGGCLLEHIAFKGYGNSSDYPNAKWAHEHGLYVGLNDQVTESMAYSLADGLNRL